MKIQINVSFFGILLIVFIILKLCKVIMWSWLWVLAPLWIPSAIGICLTTIINTIKLIKSLFRKDF